MKISHSRVECYNNCPYKYKLKYKDELITTKNQDSNNALYLGTAIHTGIQESLEKALKDYKSNYYIINDLTENEIIKLEYNIEIARVLLPKGSYEVEINDNDFIGFIDLLEKNNDGSYNIYDFKYSNNIDKYTQSPQLHLYKYYFEKTTGKK